MKSKVQTKLVALFVTVGFPFIASQQAFAATADVSSVDSFIKSLIQVLAGLAGLVATGFFVMGGFSYITSSGNPEHLDKAKRTIMYSGLGLAITIAAFVLSNIVTTLASNAFGS
ncbi:MAG TPA: TrbC/VirB2 family protein [Candidatus Saccharimonadales bacterium]